MKTTKTYSIPTRTIDLLLKGDQNVLECYHIGSEIWHQIELESGFIRNSRIILMNLADKQVLFEKQCGNRLLGREIMGIVGVARYCSERKTVKTLKDRQKALNIYLSLLKSDCSIEIQYAAEHTLRLYGYNDIVDAARG
ncbi:hypothetical protein KKH18_10570 [bacterium]|nr:hypothetical protein [bacterium]